jgi:hypothetical protein
MAARVALCLALVLSGLPAVAHARAPKAPDPAATADAQPEAQWYYAHDGRTVGPIDDAAFVDAYLRGRVTDATSVWWEGAGDWTPLAKAAWFVELDRWYVRNGDKGLGPMTGAALRASVEKAKAQGKAVETLEVRLEWSGWVPVAQAAPLHDRPAPAAWEPEPERTAAPALALASTATPSAPPPIDPMPAPTPARDIETPNAAPFDSEAHAAAMRLRKSGLITFAVGGSLIVIGGGIAGGYSTGAVGPKGLWAGVGMAAVGLLPTIIGGAMFGAGNRRLAKLERLANLRVAPLAGRDHGGIVIGGRF